MSEPIVSNSHVSVVIAAKDAADTIGAAILSALAEPEVCEVIVVDDASVDKTLAQAQLAAKGDPRVVVLQRAVNSGPAAARNAGFATATGEFISILDADDVILPGRFAALMQDGEWDFLADNILFVDDTGSISRQSSASTVPISLSLTDFVRGNLSNSRRMRGELGFIKPLIKRDFLVKSNLQYDPDMRLGEDYDLYVRALLKGARFGLSRNVGYAARVRENSLSALHRTDDLLALRSACDRHIAACRIGPAVAAMRKHRHQIHGRYLLRRFLDVKAAHGLRAALFVAIRPLSNLLPISVGLFRDKCAGLLTRRPVTPVGQTLIPQ
ncbi:MAG: glycosyltransferase family 2 protein [Pseudomonadota bacterium]